MNPWEVVVTFNALLCNTSVWLISGWYPVELPPAECHKISVPSGNRLCYLNQCLPSTVLPYGVTRQQWVNERLFSVSHCTNQWWRNVKWTPTNKFQWNFGGWLQFGVLILREHVPSATQCERRLSGKKSDKMCVAHKQCRHLPVLVDRPHAWYFSNPEQMEALGSSLFIWLM